MEKRTEGLRQEADKYAQQASHLFEEAEAMQQAADTITDAHEHHEAMQKVYSKDRAALDELQKSVELGDELIRKQQKELKRQLNEINKSRI